MLTCQPPWARSYIVCEKHQASISLVRQSSKCSSQVGQWIHTPLTWGSFRKLSSGAKKRYKASKAGVHSAGFSAHSLSETANSSVQPSLVSPMQPRVDDLMEAGTLDGLVLKHGASPLDSWDANSASAPAVIFRNGVYQMYYYGRPAQSLGQGIVCTAGMGNPFGWIGLAESTDGIHWTKVKGPLVDPPGAVFGPNEDPSAFDCVATGVGHVVEHPTNEELWMYYFGADLKAYPSPFGPGEVIGLHMQIGLAISRDGGHHWERSKEPVVAVGDDGEWDSLFVAWPKVVPPPSKGAKWHLYYHSATLKGKFSMGLATSDDGLHWTKHPQNPIMGPGADGAWDVDGVSTRSLAVIDGQYVMMYEGVTLNLGVPGAGPCHAIGLATSPDGITWMRKTEAEPCIKGSEDPEGWDAASIGTPHLVLREDGRHRLYYVGFSKNTSRSQIGLAECVDGDLLKWRKVKSPFAEG